jgi:hypothetical protein
MDVYEVLRLVKLGKSNRTIASVLGINRKTMGKYRVWAERHGLLVGDLPDPHELYQLLKGTWPGQPPPQSVSTVAPYRKVIVALREQGVEIAAIHQRLVEEHGYTGSYSSVWRFVSVIEPKQPDVVVRVEVKPGEEAQVDTSTSSVQASAMLD